LCAHGEYDFSCLKREVAMSSEFGPVFMRLREILARHAQGLTVSKDTGDNFTLEAPPGAATLRSWRGKVRQRTIPVAWVEIGKAYVSYHLMGAPGNTKLLSSLSKDLRARMQGKSCFNFRSVDDPLFRELERATAESIAGMRKGGFISEQQ
jgi:hypothetical protein